MTQLCPLCCRAIISPCYAHGNKAWMARVQPVKSSHGWWTLLEPNVYERRGVVAFHKACWTVVKDVFSPDQDYTDPTWLKSFDNALRHLNPWFQLGNPVHSPELSDAYKFDDPIGTNAGGTGCFDKFRLPTEIIQAIYGCFDDWKDVASLTEASLTPPSTKQLQSLCKKYLVPKSPFHCDTDDNTLERINWLLWKLRSKPESFPRTLNYATIWDNADLIREKLKQHVFGTDLPLNLRQTRHRVAATKRTSEVYAKTLTIGSVAKITFHFSHIKDKQYLCGFGFDENLLGYTADSSVTVPVARLRGLLLASDSYGVTSVKVKDGRFWSKHWYGAVPDGKEQSDSKIFFPTYAHLEWPPNHALHINVSLDIFKIRELAFLLDHPDTQIPPVIWDSCFPPETVTSPGRLTPSLLAELHLQSVAHRAYQFIDGKTLKSATSVTATVIPRSNILKKLDFFSGGQHVGSIGQSRLAHQGELGSLSFHLNSGEGEVINAIACAPATWSLTVMLLTNHSRSIQFGTSQGPWAVSWCEHGLFGESSMNESTGRRAPRQIISTLSTIGIFEDGSRSMADPPNLSTYGAVQLWETGTMLLEGKTEPTDVFFSSADLSHTSMITTYTTTVNNKTHISGVKLYHEDTSTILGEAAEKDKTFTLDGRLKSLSVFYEPEGKSKPRINGVRFKVGSDPDMYVAVGCLKGIHEEVKLDQYMPMLYWAFNSDFSYLGNMPFQRDSVYSIGMGKLGPLGVLPN